MRYVKLTPTEAAETIEALSKALNLIRSAYAPEATLPEGSESGFTRQDFQYPGCNITNAVQKIYARAPHLGARGIHSLVNAYVRPASLETIVSTISRVRSFAQNV